MADALPVIAVLGGTGKEGAGLALRWARAGYGVIIGSRAAARAEQAAGEIARAASGAGIRITGTPGSANQ